jgi:tetrahydromethanopterin S-methyltransferase subunit F
MRLMSSGCAGLPFGLFVAAVLLVLARCIA